MGFGMAEFLDKHVTSEQEWDKVSVPVKQCAVHETELAVFTVKLRRKKLSTSSRFSGFTTRLFSLNDSS